MKGIYLASFEASHPNHDIVYQDINGKRDIGGDMMEVNLTPYDYIIATPPCNYWSRANYRRDSSEYALKTKHLLPDIIKKLCKQEKPFIIENVRNNKMFNKYNLMELPCYVYLIGRHTYWSNIYVDTLNNINQVAKTDFKNGKKRYLSSQNLGRKQRQGGQEVHEVIECWLNAVENKDYYSIWLNKEESICQ